ncbi:MAG TPA: S8 family peptidase [Paraburkholderia sp.]|uniref:S8 family peptidase n=1 Tax=Paraburkholderia sp. TaxID=1926495 RepID=UPI002ED1952A
MPHYEHLRLVRLPEQFERRKHGGGGPPPQRDPRTHSARLSVELDNTIAAQRARRRPEFVDPALILRVRMAGALQEGAWEGLGLTVLSSDADRSLVLFADTDDLRDFRQRLNVYAQGVPAGQINPAYAAFVANIESIGGVEPRDRIGVKLREDGFAVEADFVDGQRYTLDLELWDFGWRDLRERKLDEIGGYIAARGGEVLDRYIGPSISMLRMVVEGPVVRALLGIDVVANIDLPPQPDIGTAEALALDLAGIPELNRLDADAPLIGVIDSGINDHPLIEDILVGAIGVPETLGTADVWGHGTRVGGIAVFGDIKGQLAAGTLNRGARLCSAKVVNDQGGFDNRRLVPSQMREAITTLHRRFGCRIFVIALGDKRLHYDGGKVGAWAATLDELVRELDLVIVVSAGNRHPRGGNRVEQAVTDYPDYLVEAANRVLEPAGAMNVVTVGALSHGTGIAPELADDVRVRPITGSLEPSPFTRVGPGIAGSVKPDLVDFGGTMVFDAVTASLRNGDDLPSAGVVSLHHLPVEQLFTARSGTSYAAPTVAFKASQILSLLPNASANLVRALLVGAARVPTEASDRLGLLGADAIDQVCGHGLVDLERAAYSDDARVVLYAEDELAIDHFAVYEVPIPADFQQTPGRRTVKVSLAFDPPVRHTRTDYTGIGMSFRLIRGCDAEEVFEHYRRRNVAVEGAVPEMAARYACKLEPGPQTREKATLQCASVTFQRDVSVYGDRYYLVVRCEGGWAQELVQSQRFAVVVEISHEQEIRLYQQIRVRVRA